MDGKGTSIKGKVRGIDKKGLCRVELLKISPATAALRERSEADKLVVEASARKEKTKPSLVSIRVAQGER